jgi:hypothetical protein
VLDIDGPQMLTALQVGHYVAHLAIASDKIGSTIFRRTVVHFFYSLVVYFDAHLSSLDSILNL